MNNKKLTGEVSVDRRGCSCLGMGINGESLRAGNRDPTTQHDAWRRPPDQVFQDTGH